MTAPAADEWQTKALASFPFEIVETSGENALAQWEQLKAAGRGVPVVVGDIAGILEPFSADQHATRRPVEETLAAANSIRLPEGLFKMRRDETVAALELLRKLDPSSDSEIDDHEPPLGAWPAATSASPGLSVAYDILTRQPLAKVHISCWSRPRTHHCSGASAVGHLRVGRNPASRGKAIELARLQYTYCNDIVDQGTDSSVRWPPSWWPTTGGSSGGTEPAARSLLPSQDAAGSMSLLLRGGASYDR